MQGTLNTDARVPHELNPAEALKLFGTHLHHGLSSREAQTRLERFGPNALPTGTKRTAFGRLLLQFRDVQVYLLLTAAAVSLLVWTVEHASGFPYEAIAILAIVLLNACFGFLQEAKADHALAALRSMTPAEASVLRDGQVQRIPAERMVPGDLIVVREGDRIAADARLVEVTAFHTQESALTGESTPVLKTIEPMPRETASADRRNMILSGTIAISGHARAVVTATGTHTEFGGIAQLLSETKEPETPLQKELSRLGRRLGASVVLIAFVVVGTLLVLYGTHDSRLVMKALIFGVALAVAATPEGLAALVTVVLALGVQRMARRGAVVRHLPAVETLGAATVIASDKTGTMTLNEMTVREVVTASGTAVTLANGYVPDGTWTLPEGGDLPAALKDELVTMLKVAALVNNAALQNVDGKWKIQGDPTEAALLVSAVRAQINLTSLQRLYPRIGEIPFSSERKSMSTMHRCSGEDGSKLFRSYALLSKGAADLLLQRCTHEVVAGDLRLLTERRRAEILATQDELASRALRTLGFAIKPMLAAPLNAQGLDEQEEREFAFLGLVGMIDPLRPETKDAVVKAAAAGVRTIMITGDHAATALAIANDLGITTETGVITGRDLGIMTDGELASALRRTSVFARVNPEHKLRIVRALQRNGEIVAMTGDGVNDAPALKAADIGVAMGLSGTDVAKEAADLVLTDDNFATIVAAIEEGRTLYDNIRKFLRYLLATNSGEILTLFGGVILTRSMNMGAMHELVLPLLAVQILWVNLVTDGAPALALGLDPPTRDIMHRPPFAVGRPIIDRLMLADIWIVAVVMAAGTLWNFAYGASAEKIELRRSLAFITLILFQLFNTFEARSSLTSGFARLFENKWLWGTIGSTFALQLILFNLSPFEYAFGVVALSPAQWFRCTLVASSVLWVMEAVKWMRRVMVGRKVSDTLHPEELAIWERK